MKRNLGLILTGMLALGVQAQQTATEATNPKITAKERTEEVKRREVAKLEAEYFESAAKGYLTAAQDRKTIVEEYTIIADQYTQNIEQGVETNYPAAWITVATYKREIGRLEKQIGNNILKYESLLEKAHESLLEIGVNKISLLERKKDWDYQPHYKKSREAYQDSLKYFKQAGDKANTASVMELMASEDEQTANIYRTMRKK